MACYFNAWQLFLPVKHITQYCVICFEYYVWFALNITCDYFEYYVCFALNITCDLLWMFTCDLLWILFLFLVLPVKQNKRAHKCRRINANVNETYCSGRECWTDTAWISLDGSSCVWSLSVSGLCGARSLHLTHIITKGGKNETLLEISMKAASAICFTLKRLVAVRTLISRG